MHPLLALALAVPALAEEPAAPAAEAPKPEAAAEAPKPEAKPKTEFAGSGVYTIWGLQQHNFLLGKDHPLDDAGYTVQMLRAKVDVKRGTYGITTRFDAAQGWWGVDNDPNVGTSVTEDDKGLTTGQSYNPNSLFGDKDTNYALHVDIAYAWAEWGPLRVQAGRQFYGVGNLLVLDEDYEGVVATLEPKEGLFVDAMWAHVSEGRASATTPAGTQMSDDPELDMSDVNLFGLRGRLDGDAVDAEVFALYWRDDIATDYTHLPNGLGYAKSRFSPNISQLGAFGVAANGKHGGLEWKAEGDFLYGRDDVDNADHAGGLLDVNDGVLMGWNGYADAKQTVDVGVPLDVGAIVGIGSGDPDPTSGHGNVNKIATMGFFPFLNVWEDSVMPDVEGISPQGLGSPVSRGYREFENTTALAGRVGVKPVEPLRLEVVGAYLTATEPITAFDATGTPTSESARDLGWEIDGNATLTFENGIQLRSLFGWFQPGTAAGYLINGTDDFMDPAWELKNEAIVKF